jgi:hypothetical protein
MPLVDAPDDLDEFNAWAWNRRWSDGLPLVPPTRERVDTMLRGTTWSPEAVIGMIPPRQAEATVELIAANAVMAGCGPTAMPILIAAVEAAMSPEVNLLGVQATTHPCALMMMASGPIARAAGIHGGSGLFGPGFPSNATIGRAVRLIQQNLGGAWPAETDHATQGTPAKFSFCFTENEERNPWDPYRVAQGYDVAHSTVTVVGVEGPHNLNDHVSREPAGVLFTFAHSIATIGTNNAYLSGAELFLAVCPEHAELFSRHGLERTDVQEYLFDRARIPFKYWRRGGMFGMRALPKKLESADDDYPVPVLADPADVHLFVAGGPGLHSAWMPSFGLSRAATRVVRGPDGSPLHSPGQHSI